MSGVCCLSFLDASAGQMLSYFWVLSWQITREEFHAAKLLIAFFRFCLADARTRRAFYIFGRFFVDFEVALQTDLAKKLVDCHRKERSTESPP